MAFVCLMPPEKIQVIASRIRHTDFNKAAAVLRGEIGTPVALGVLNQLIDTWRDSQVNASELALMLLSASYVYTRSTTAQSTELVWTGPTTPFVAARRTDQALLQVINASKDTLFITSFVAYEISSIVKACNEATDRGVMVSMLLESSLDHGGSITIDAIGKMSFLAPAIQLYAWVNKDALFCGGRVHAKVAVADSDICFITSANLTNYAMNKNMEIGVLITGGSIPGMLNDHLHGLVKLNIIERV